MTLHSSVPAMRIGVQRGVPTASRQVLGDWVEIPVPAQKRLRAALKIGVCRGVVGACEVLSQRLLGADERALDALAGDDVERPPLQRRLGVAGSFFYPVLQEIARHAQGRADALEDAEREPSGWETAHAEADAVAAGPSGIFTK